MLLYADSLRKSTRNTSGPFHCKKLGIVRARGEQNRVSSRHTYGQLPGIPAKHRADGIPVQPRCNILMELCDRRFADMVKPVGLAVVIANRVPVTAGNHRFHCIGRDSSSDLDSIDIDREIVCLPCLNTTCALISATPALMN